MWARDANDEFTVDVYGDGDRIEIIYGIVGRLLFLLLPIQYGRMADVWM